MYPETESASTAFDPAHEGTSERRWVETLAGTPPLLLPQAEVVVVSPHPDDETLGAGGLIRTASIRGHKVSVLSVTDGEAAYPDWMGLRKVRRREVKRALSVLSPYPLTRRRLGIPDGYVAQHLSLLHDALERMVTPTTLIVAPYEHDGHPDHEAVGEVCMSLARRQGLTLWRYPIWLWHHGEPDHLVGRNWGRFWFDDETRRSKGLAIDCFSSQLRPSARVPIVPSHVLPYFARPYEAFLL